MRRYETDYAGAFKGHALTRENAIIAAMKHMVRDGYTTCTITDKHTNIIVAWVRVGDDRKTAIVTTVKQLRKIIA